MRLRPKDEPELWQKLFRELERDAFHLEVRDSYAVPNESERLRRFLAGEPPLDTRTPWQDLMRETTGRGVSVSRVRVVTVPHSDYQRWLLSVTVHNVAAGEDIRYLPRHLAGEVPPDDWWLMDDERVVYNLTDAAGAPAGLGETTDPRIVEYCRSVRQRLWASAIPYAEYANR
ncbi:hypothetical protein APR12_000658 [Nocardia amikacinitolerans]|uniref:DUF6879 family protein n=1 Tax=Nocardia amikacinitolerans TaxID=756689 RepID=UPI000A95E419|nr:DUF6879 family protein [Nocardia amikacinitolerans]MCP2315328.1 hypothetical protein [Nocardia amikacinitolerans]